MKPEYSPEEIGSSEDESRFRILWKDGHVTEQAPRSLRLQCPCAACIEELTGRRVLIPESVPADVYPTAIHYVGRYALQFMWSDGHSTGIYTFEYLRRLGSLS